MKKSKLIPLKILITNLSISSLSKLFNSIPVKALRADHIVKIITNKVPNPASSEFFSRFIFQGENPLKIRKIIEPSNAQKEVNFAPASFLNVHSAPVSIPEMLASWIEICIGSIPLKRRRIPQIIVKTVAAIPPISPAANTLRH